MEEVQPVKVTSMVVKSPGDGTLIAQDWKAIGKKALFALAPYILVLIPVLIDQLPKDWAYLPTAMFLLGRLKDVLIYATKETSYKV